MRESRHNDPEEDQEGSFSWIGLGCNIGREQEPVAGAHMCERVMQSEVTSLQHCCQRLASRMEDMVMARLGAEAALLLVLV
jgi:hypothetical protein